MAEKFVIRHESVALFKISCAESEKLINQYYQYNPFFNQAEDFSSLKTFFIGRTGIGKSAIIENLHKKIETSNNSRDKVIKISPEDFVFDVAERSETIKELTGQNINLGLIYKTLWKSIFITEILKAVFGNKKKSFLDRISTFGIESRAYKFLEDMNELDGDKSISERVQSLVNRMEHEVSAEVKISDIGVKYSGKLPPEIKDKINKRMQKFEVSELRYFIKKIDTDILQHQRVYLFIDDLDKNWIPNEISKKLIGALFESIIDFSNLTKVKIVISLRTNLFQQIELHQPEKYNQFIEYIYWTPQEIHNICQRRINKIFQSDFGSSVYKRVFPDKIHTDNNKIFDFADYLISRTNLRPRDAIHFLSYIFEETINKSKVTQGDVFKGEIKYSEDRLDALFVEWDNPYTGISFLKDYLSYHPHRFTSQEIMTVLDQIFDFVDKNKDDSSFQQHWLIQYNFIDTINLDSTNLLKLLYKIGLIGVKKSGSTTINFSHHKGYEKFDPPKNNEYRIYINPCYYKALNTTFY